MINRQNEVDQLQFYDPDYMNCGGKKTKSSCSTFFSTSRKTSKIVGYERQNWIKIRSFTPKEEKGCLLPIS